MLCDKCKMHTATTHVKQTVNGQTTELNLCPACAAKLGLADPFGSFGLDLGDFWGSLFAPPAIHSHEDELRCPDCGASFRQIAESGKPGCPTCYLTFYERLLPSIQRIHGKTKHTGKVAQQADEKTKNEHELKQLKEELARLIAEQEYEKCAELRDKIRKLEEGATEHEG